MKGQPVAATSVRTIADGDDWLPEKHEKDFQPGDLPDSLLTAIRSFLITCAIRDIRAAEGTPGRGGPIHRSMLVNVSRFTAVQDRVADAIHVCLEDIRRTVRLHGALPADQAAGHSPDIAALEAVFDKDFKNCGTPWTMVLASLHEAIAPVRVQAVNQRTGAASLDYGVTDKPPGVRVIAVGGNSLSRGLTLEGLSTSYFRRDPRAYDTLLQMGRWFGYRDGYLDLCRVWLTEEAEGWYKHVTRATGELKRDFARMKRMALRASSRSQSDSIGLRCAVPVSSLCNFAHGTALKPTLKHHSRSGRSKSGAWGSDVNSDSPWLGSSGASAFNSSNAAGTRRATESMNKQRAITFASGGT